MPPILYDISRLSTRVLNAAPNGIDRIDGMLAHHFLRHEAVGSPLLFGFRGPRLFAPERALDPLRALERAWGEYENFDQVRLGLANVLNRFEGVGRLRASRERDQFMRLPHAQKAVRIASAIRYGFRKGADPRRMAPAHAIYLNASHFPLEQERHVAWLKDRPDVKPIIFVHDLLPLRRPELFWSKEPHRHRLRLEFLMKRGAGAITTSKEVCEDLRAFARERGRADLPIFCARPPIEQQFKDPAYDDPRLAALSYFVVCGTIEPRKNHLILLQVWRRLVDRFGEAAPKLIIVGKRGWRCEEIVAAIEHPRLHQHVVEVSGLSTPTYRALLRHARALLSPSHAEGFGLPVAEALAAGIPVIAADIPPYREQAGEAALYLDPNRLDDWRDAIIAYSALDSRARADGAARTRAYAPICAEDYMKGLENFLRGFKV